MSIEDILEYMRLFKILLVVDNYETVTDKSLRPLLTGIPTGSKVLLTSRVGLGELEIRYKLDPLDLKTSVSLMRRFAKSLNVEMLYASTDKKLERYADLLYFNPLLIKWFTQSVSMGSDPEKLATKGNSAFDKVLQYCFENLFSRLKEEERKVLHFLAASRRPLTPTELLFLMQKISDISPSRLDEALSTLHSSSMLKRSPVDSKSSDGTIQISLTDVASDYIARFAPPDKGIFEKIQVASKQLRVQVQRSSVRQAAYKFDLFSVRAKTTDQRISAFHLNTALEFSKIRDYQSARKSVAEAKALLPSFAEAYRISALIESKDGELYKASQEIEEAAQYDSQSAIIHYQYANLLLYQLEDFDGALLECENAIKCDPNEETLSTLKALILTRLGRYSEAAPMYDVILMDIANRPHKWRLSTRDQAAECYRRFGEQDRAMKDTNGFFKHIDRACLILEDAMAVGDVDRGTGNLYTNIIEDALYLALGEKNETYAKTCFSRLSDASHLLKMPVFKTLKLEYFEIAFGSESIVTRSAKEYFERFARVESVIAMMQAASSETRLVGKIKTILRDKSYGFITDANGADWFLSQSVLRNAEDWPLLHDGTLVQFSPSVDAKQRRRAVDLVIMRSK